MSHDGSETGRPNGLNSTWPSRTLPAWNGAAPSELGTDAETATPDASSPGTPLWSRWPAVRLRFPIGGVVLGVALWVALVHALAGAPRLDASWRADLRGRVEVVASGEPALRERVGQYVVALTGTDGAYVGAEALALNRSPRWIVDRARLMHEQTLQTQLAAVLAQDTVKLSFTDGASVTLHPSPRGVAGLPVLFWLLSAFSACLYVEALLVVSARSSGSNWAFAAMAWCQAGNLLFIAVETTYESGLFGPLVPWDTPMRMAFDLCSAAAVVHGACLYPRRLKRARTIAAAGWTLAVAVAAGTAAGWLDAPWWWTQASAIALGVASVGLLSWSYRIEPHPMALVLQRFGILTVSTWTLMTLALASSDRWSNAGQNVADVGTVIWYVFFAATLMLVPFLAKPQAFLREFVLVGAVSTVATSLDLLLTAWFSLGAVAAMTLALVIALAVYAGVRPWILNQLQGGTRFTTERVFEQLYRIAREVEVRPDRTPALLSQLLSELFEPLEVNLLEHSARRARVAGEGAGLVVPLPALGEQGEHTGSMLLRFAHGGRRLFTAEDARLTDRVVEQLRRAVHFDRAFEQGRSEERLRLAQDLHDDIGARLLTLMYQAQSAEMEDYLRHTLQDLKTLTRGLAASNHLLSHAAAEWKADLTHRLQAAGVRLDWNVAFDVDIQLSVVHWSALTRILRELVSNVIAHAQASGIEIDFRLENDRIDLTITDDGVGRNPRTWSHGLGLGGVRKRVKQLGGTVEWVEAAPRGIRCHVTLSDLSTRW